MGRFDARCKFRGQNGSLGYKTGKEYNLEISERYFLPDKSGIIYIDDLEFDKNGTSNNDYGSINAFLNNWKVIQVNMHTSLDNINFSNSVISLIKQNIRDNKLDSLLSNG